MIPARAHTYSRTDEVFPGNAPKIMERSKGVYTWDVDGNKYIDYGMACRSVTVGYDHDRISDAAIRQIHNGNTATKASKIEVEAADMMCSLFPWVDMIKFAKNGPTVTSEAIKPARYGPDVRNGKAIHCLDHIPHIWRCKVLRLIWTQYRRSSHTQIHLDQNPGWAVLTYKITTYG